MIKNLISRPGARARTKEVIIGGISIGGHNPIAIQSMTNTDTSDLRSTLAQIKKLEKAGCQTVRLAVPNQAAARALKHIRQSSKLPLVADIHFDHRLALLALEAGVDKLRINPGN
ncbi:MAG: flavodoxin-dependent (E)-4-hydroxy-3-methylbut-2-enyl-diphosphate synthase, partial [Desulfocucumaceae bacterium]